MMEFGDNYMAHLPNTNGGNYGVAFQRQGAQGHHSMISNGRNAMMNGEQSIQNGEYFPVAGSGLNINDPRYAAKYGNPYLRNPGNLEDNDLGRGRLLKGNGIDGINSSPGQSPLRNSNTMGSNGRPYATLNTRNGRPFSPNSGVYRNNPSYGTIQQKGAKNGNRDKVAGQNYGGTLLPGVLTENAKMVGSTTLSSASNAAAVANKYIGTMLGNGSITRSNNDNVTNASIDNKSNPSQRGGRSISKGKNPSGNINDASGNGRIAENLSIEGGVGVVHQAVANNGSPEFQYIMSPNNDSAGQAALATHV